MRTTSEIAEAFDLGILVGNQVDITSVAISSLDVVPGCLFIVVKGERRTELISYPTQLLPEPPQF